MIDTHKQVTLKISQLLGKLMDDIDVVLADMQRLLDKLAASGVLCTTLATRKDGSLIELTGSPNRSFHYREIGHLRAVH